MNIKAVISFYFYNLLKDTIVSTFRKQAEIIQDTAAATNNKNQKDIFSRLAQECKTQIIKDKDGFWSFCNDVNIVAGSAVNKRITTKLNFDLIHAVEEQDLGKIKELLKIPGVDINNKVKSYTPLTKAILLKNNQIAEYLIKKGANHKIIYRGYYYSDESGYINYFDSLELAIYQNNEKIVDLILRQQKSSDDTNAFDNSYIAVAVKFNQKEMVKKLIDKGLNPDLKGRYGCPLELAVLNNNTEITKTLLQKANPNLKGITGYPLQIAVRDHNMPIIELLLNHGANPNIHIQTYGEKAPLWTIVFEKMKMEILSLLWQKSDDLKWIDKNGNNALILLLKSWGRQDSKYKEVNKDQFSAACKALLNKGVSFNLKNKDGISAFELAEKMKETDLIDLMKHVENSAASKIQKFYRKFSDKIKHNPKSDKDKSSEDKNADSEKKSEPSAAHITAKAFSTLLSICGGSTQDNAIDSICAEYDNPVKLDTFDESTQVMGLGF